MRSNKLLHYSHTRAQCAISRAEAEGPARKRSNPIDNSLVFRGWGLGVLEERAKGEVAGEVPEIT